MTGEQQRLEVINGLLALFDQREALWEAVSQSVDEAELIHRLRGLNCSHDVAQIAASTPLSGWTVSRIVELRSERDQLTAHRTD